MSLTIDKILQNVSRETLVQLEVYHELLLKWQNKINLISPETASDAWQRHFIDSMQLHQYLSRQGSLVDLGSGAGFPGLVLAIMGVERVTLIESDRRKCIFMREIIRVLGLKNVTVCNQRIENVTNIKADFITARALASLDQLVKWSRPFLKPETVLLFAKGRQYQAEIDTCDFSKKISMDVFDSVTEEGAKIIRLSQLFLN